jgi:hypothetical protein
MRTAEQRGRLGSEVRGRLRLLNFTRCDSR